MLIVRGTYLMAVVEMVCVTVTVRVTDDWTVNVLTIVDLGVEHVVNFRPAFATQMSVLAAQLSVLRTDETGAGLYRRLRDVRA